jgi:hypothetical protein
MSRVLSSREKNIFLFTAGIIIFALGFNYFLAPLFSSNDSLNRQISAGRSKLRKYSWLIANKERIRKKYSRFSSPSAGDSRDIEVEVFSGLEAIARESGVRIVDLRPQSGQARRGPYRENLIELRAEGSSDNYLKFLYNIENSLYLFKVKKFQLNAKSASSSLEGIFLISQFAAPD